jgi:hypothetical protein
VWWIGACVWVTCLGKRTPSCERLALSKVHRVYKQTDIWTKDHSIKLIYCKYEPKWPGPSGVAAINATLLEPSNTHRLRGIFGKESIVYPSLLASTLYSSVNMLYTILPMMKCILSIPPALKDISFTLSWTSGYFGEPSLREIFRRILTLASGVDTRLQNNENFQLFCELRLRRSRQYSPHFLR